MKKEIFYPKDFKLPESINLLGKISFRMFKFKCQNKKWCIRRFKNLKQIEKFLISENPLACYFSVNEYINPHRVENATYKIHKKILSTLMAIDIDCLDKKIAKKTFNLLKSLNYKNIFFVISGRGWQFLATPKMINVEKERKQLIKKLKENKIPACYEVTEDPTRIMRLWGTYNYKSKTFSELINPNLLSKRSMLERFKKPMTKYRKDTPAKTSLPNKETQHNLFRHKFITNKYKKAFVFFTTFKNLKIAKEKIKKLREYNLGDLYYIDYGDSIGVLSTKIIKKQRLIKILRKIKRGKTFERYGKSFIRVSGYNRNGKTFLNPKNLFIKPNYLNTFESYYHLDFLKNIGFKIDKKTKIPKIYEGISICSI